MKKARNAKAKKAKTYQVPEWMDDKLKKAARKLDATQRLAMADDLEKQASQLRGMQQPVEFCREVKFPIRPKAEAALLAFAHRHGANCEARYAIPLAAKWVVETALTMMPQISEACFSEARYRIAEGFHGTELNEARIAKSMQEWSALVQDEDEEDEDED